MGYAGLVWRGLLWLPALWSDPVGLSLTFSPCVLPMIPILSSMLLGRGVSTRQGLILSVAVGERQLLDSLTQVSYAKGGPR